MYLKHLAQWGDLWVNKNKENRRRRRNEGVDEGKEKIWGGKEIWFVVHFEPKRMVRP